ncbi:hypothetical protein D1224_02960 [Henriciella barbarensis]|jgi:uncharacterized protein (TIGR02391 family)|uniref:Conserved hypothetical protein CHP02391 domain-containing protein n=2 Tax=Henriciella TaxID=453849 RepID=A0A399QYP9_9PROT|nr:MULTISPECIES: TIGR02391 family protein [Henriciella]MCZ4298241.1 hypothetical protein [Henriciella marina]RIJ23255.1 hypothetical protein D1224_02960 [Henriciella barbarensis]HIG21852.1 hypothetical protein [Henriciella sp.]HIK65218.1 hypothetical protein [Henriciella marina]|tara:strand:- start:743 stop:1630 length:888 start_codon:yes stop_codon:yes gene_type:complete
MAKAATQQAAGLAYHGLSGVTRPCEEAVLEALQRETRIERARILSFREQHGLLLINAVGDGLVIRPGFASGYSGEGPSGLSKAIAMLSAHEVQIDEVDLTPAEFQRLDDSVLTESDLQDLAARRAVRIGQYQDYMFRGDWDDARAGRLWSHYPARLPLAALAPGLIDLVLEFDTRPGHALHLGYIRLEDRLRKLTCTRLSGTRLVDAAFSPKHALLKLSGREDPGEQAGLEFLFRGVLQLHRNPHAHSELNRSPVEAVSEFLVLNHLFRLLDAVEVANGKAGKDPSDEGSGLGTG